MRINLVTPFAEKDAVKALGARWDAAKKCWYIVDVVDLAPFVRWIADIAAATGVSGNTLKMAKPKVSIPKRDTAQITSGDDVAGCGCDVLPWGDCVHTKKQEGLLVHEQIEEPMVLVNETPASHCKCRFF
jgi:hypothetical protein